MATSNLTHLSGVQCADEPAYFDQPQVNDGDRLRASVDLSSLLGQVYVKGVRKPKNEVPACNRSLVIIYPCHDRPINSSIVWHIRTVTLLCTPCMVPGLCHRGAPTAVSLLVWVGSCGYVKQLI